MTIYLDLGNTRLRLAGPSRAGRLEVVDSPADIIGSPALGELLARMAEGVGDRQPLLPRSLRPAAYVASVAPSREPLLEAALSAAGWRPVFARSTDAGLLPHTLTTPETTGIDRLLAALGAVGEYAAAGTGRPGHSGALVVVQAGTAVTIDWVDAIGRFRGGLIMPGPALWRAGFGSLAHLPAAAPAAVGAAPPLPNTPRLKHPAGACTADALAGGLAVGLPGAVAGGVLALRQAALDEAPLCGGSPSVRVVLTGGWADALLEAWRGMAYHPAYPDLAGLGAGGEGQAPPFGSERRPPQKPEDAGNGNARRLSDKWVAESGVRCGAPPAADQAAGARVIPHLVLAGLRRWSETGH